MISNKQGKDFNIFQPIYLLDPSAPRGRALWPVRSVPPSCRSPPTFKDRGNGMNSDERRFHEVWSESLRNLVWISKIANFDEKMIFKKRLKPLWSMKSLFVSYVQNGFHRKKPTQTKGCPSFFVMPPAKPMSCLYRITVGIPGFISARMPGRLKIDCWSVACFFCLYKKEHPILPSHEFLFDEARHSHE